MEKEVFLSDEKEPHVVNLTFEDWEKGIWPNLYFDEPFFEKMVYSNEHEAYIWYTLKEDEYQRIYDAKKKIFERNVGLFLEQIVKEFETSFRSKEVGFIRSELAKITSLLEDKECKAGFSFPKPNSRINILDIDDILFNSEWKGNKYAHEYAAKWKYPFVPITWKDEPDYSLPLCVAVGVLVEYRNYLEGLLNGEPKKEIIGGKGKTVKPFRSIFKGENEFSKLINAICKCGLASQDGDTYKWTYDGQKLDGVGAMFEAAKDAGLLKDKLKNKSAISLGIRDFFGFDSLSHTTLDNINPNSGKHLELKKKIRNHLN
jgi:hypothetical protein